MPTIPSQAVFDRIVRKLDAYLADPQRTRDTIPSYVERIGPTAASLISDVLKADLSYRDALIIQIAFGLENALSKSHTLRPKGARGVGSKIGRALNERHIAAVKDAYQNIGKSTEVLARGNVPSFDSALMFLDGATIEVRKNAFSYAVASVSLTARKVLKFPDIDRAKLTFRNCAILYDALFKIPSGGAYQQYSVASCLEAFIDESGQGGVLGLRVETKRLNASDAASKVIGDIQILKGNRIEEAFEITANDWRLKVSGALRSLRDGDLQRIHVLASVETAFPADSSELDIAGADITVIDVASFVRTLIAIMRKPARNLALQRLYEMLDRFQPDIERTNAYVRLLHGHGLTS